MKIIAHKNFDGWNEEKNDKFHCAVRAKSSTVWIKLTQARVISHHRLVRKLDILSVKEFEKVKQAFKKYI